MGGDPAGSIMVDSPFGPGSGCGAPATGGGDEDTATALFDSSPFVPAVPQQPDGQGVPDERLTAPLRNAVRALESGLR